ncbi:MAG: TolB family protein, partial [Planctomycetota bacterium]
MSIKCQVINMPRLGLCILTLGILCLGLEGHTFGEPITAGRALSNGLIAFADAPGRRPGPQVSQYAQIYTITPDGRNQQQLTTGEPGNFFPAWSADGEQLAFVSTRNHKREIWIIDSSGKNERLITSGFLPAWSPDGRQLAITRADAKRRRQI